MYKILHIFYVIIRPCNLFSALNGLVACAQKRLHVYYLRESDLSIPTKRPIVNVRIEKNNHAITILTSFYGISGDQKHL